MTQAQIIIPLQNNDGRAFPTHLVDSWAEEARLIFGGATLRRSAQGYWTGADRSYSEPVAVLEIDILDGLHLRGQVLSLARSIKRAFSQEAVYVRFIPIETVLV